MAKKTIYKTVISYTILSEEPYEHMSLTGIENECENGQFIGGNLVAKVFNRELVGKNAVIAINKLCSDPEFFMMDCEGNEIEEDEE